MAQLFKCFIAGLFAILMAPASADPIGGPTNIDCAATNCFGSLITLEYEQVGNDPAHFHITLTIDSTTNTIASQWIQAVAIKVHDGNSDDISGSLLSTTAAGTWAYVEGGLSNGCDAGMAGFQCASTSDTTNTAGVYEWVFDAIVADASNWALADFASHVKVNYDTATQPNGLQTSADITLQPGGNTVPEPQTLALLAVGLLGLAIARRRRSR